VAASAKGIRAGPFQALVPPSHHHPTTQELYPASTILKTTMRFITLSVMLASMAAIVTAVSVFSVNVLALTDMFHPSTKNCAYGDLGDDSELQACCKSRAWRVANPSYAKMCRSDDGK